MGGGRELRLRILLCWRAHGAHGRQFAKCGTAVGRAAEWGFFGLKHHGPRAPLGIFRSCMGAPLAAQSTLLWRQCLQLAVAPRCGVPGRDGMTSLLKILQLSSGLLVAALIALAPSRGVAQSSDDTTAHAGCAAGSELDAELARHLAWLSVVEPQHRTPAAAFQYEAPELEDDENAPALHTCALVPGFAAQWASSCPVASGARVAGCSWSSQSRPCAHPRDPPVS